MIQHGPAANLQQFIRFCPSDRFLRVFLMLGLRAIERNKGSGELQLWIASAQADGFPWAQRLERKADVTRVVADFIGFKGPAFLEVVIDPDAGVYPMVGPGQCYDEMITGDHILSRGQGPTAAPDASEMF